MQSDRAIVIGAGVGGLATAIDLARHGIGVTVVERGGAPGGKIRQVTVADQPVDAGPTVFTMRDVFERLFADAGRELGDYLELQPADILARHGWPDGSRLDLHADLDTTAEAIAAFAGSREAGRFRRFSQRAAETYGTLNQSFIRAERPGPAGLARRVGLGRVGALWRINPFNTLWEALSREFKDPRLRQLYARYATYCGSSPLQAPATLMLVAHVERQGVWLIRGGMRRLADALAQLAGELGVTLRYGTEVTRITTDGRGATGVRLADGEALSARTVVVNADAAAVADGLFGDDVAGAAEPVATADRSLSALTWALTARPDGFPLAYHNVFFNRDYPSEFTDIFEHRRSPRDPTVYVCAQDRGDDPGVATGDDERLFCIVNAPPDGDRHPLSDDEIDQCETRARETLAACGLTLNDRPGERVVTTPTDFHRLFPATGGALYGQASHGWTASFRRPGASTSVAGLYLAGGSTHPGPGVPMATLSGRLAARRIVADLTSASTSPKTVTSGGTWTL